MKFLRAGVLVPFLYYGAVLVASLFYPGYSHGRQYASELGSNSATYPQIFNTGIILTGVTILLSLIGFRTALRGLNARPVLTWLFLVSLAGFGVGMLMGGFFPMPDPRHGGFGLGVLVHLSPFLLAAALWRDAGTRGLRYFLLANGVAALVMFAIMMGVGELVRLSNVGAYQRAYSSTVFPWIGLAAGALVARFRSPLPAPGSAPVS